MRHVQYVPRWILFVCGVFGVACLLASCAQQSVPVEINDGHASAFGFRTVHTANDPAMPASSATTADLTTPSSLADEIFSLAPLVPGEFPQPREVNRPIGFRAPSIDVDVTTVVDVGVDEEGFLAVPGVSEVGWYQFGPSPGETGSSVLAAHIAFNGRDGVFRDLPALEVGDEIFVKYEDETEQAFEVLGIVQYDKDNLPIDSLFERRGQPRLVLITCGGDFNPQLRSYDDNIIAYAVPVG